jgi:hypothetical protein
MGCARAGLGDTGGGGGERVKHPDALALANRMDEAWHDQPRSFEREAVTRFWGLLTLPARVLDPERPRAMLSAASVLRNARFKGDAVKGMFFANKDFTEVDALFLSVGSSLGHVHGEAAWVVEVERKSANQQGDYYLAIQRAREFAALLRAQFGVHARPVVIFEDDGGRYSYKDFDGEVLLISMGALRERTRGLRFPSLGDLPGLACDKTLVKLAILRQLVAGDPNHPEWYGGPLALVRAIEADGLNLHLPVVGHQDTGKLPNVVGSWLARDRETELHLADRIDRYLGELHASTMLERLSPAPRLSFEGGQVVLNLLRVESEEPE